MRLTINRFKSVTRKAEFLEFVGPVALLRIEGTGVTARYPFRLADGIGDDPKMNAWRINVEDLEKLRNMAREQGIKFRTVYGDPRYSEKRKRAKSKVDNPKQEKLFE